MVAEQLNWHYLDSGALYRIIGYASSSQSIDLDDENKVIKLASSLDIHFHKNGDILLSNQNIKDQIRTEQAGMNASKVAAHARLRQHLIQIQRDFLALPGLVADGRDMASVVFPDAQLKVFLTASAEERAQRRYNQLLEKGDAAKIDEILSDIVKRDRQDQEREVAPLLAMPDSIVIDTTSMTIDQVINQLVSLCKERLELTI